MRKSILFISLLALLLAFACKKKETIRSFPETTLEFDTSLLKVKSPNHKAVKGQLLYMPIYSSIPYEVDSAALEFDMSAFVAIHNTDLSHEIELTKVMYFNARGKMVYDFLRNQTKKLKPLETIDYYIPHEDKSGTGANFLIEWIAPTAVNEPLIESITINLKTYRSAAIVSQGRIIKEIK